ncbi:MAG: ATP-binding protein [Spirochaetia bacterium]
MLHSQVLIIDEIGYTPIEKREANLFFNLISEMYEKQSVIITSNKSFSVWTEMMGDEIMTTLTPFICVNRMSTYRRWLCRDCLKILIALSFMCLIWTKESSTIAAFWG